ncbi:hypothetical protein DFH06DRAFT_1150285 [Mycena polygramma]|nr:hypothetical protein DFH06DRAFT_1150285 [Mycena polygramma]
MTPKLKSARSLSTTGFKQDLADRASSCVKKLIEIRNVCFIGLAHLCCKFGALADDATQQGARMPAFYHGRGPDRTRRVVARGLHDLDTANRETAMTHLEDDLKRYQSIVKDTADILAEWTSMAWIKRAWKCGDFADIAASIDRKLCSFRDLFSLARLIDLSKGQNDLQLKMGQVINQGVRQNLKEWLKPANVGASHRSAAAERHPGSGLWLLEESAQFREWMYSPNSFLWLYGILLRVLQWRTFLQYIQVL